MNTKEMRQLQKRHEKLGEETFDRLQAAGVKNPPPVGWSTVPVSLSGITSAFVVWDEEYEDCECVQGFPRDMLVGEVVRRILARLVARN